MTKKARRTIFYVFLGVFIILVPMIIFYALGYAFDFAKRTVSATGGIYLKSLPSGANIYLNGKPAGKTSKFIRRLAPKIYNIILTKEDYYPWEKNLTVEPELVAKAENILLIPSNPQISLVATESTDYSWFETKITSPSYYLSGANLYETKTGRILVKNAGNFVIYKDGLIYLDNTTGKIFELDLTSLKSAEIFDRVFPSLNKGKWILSGDNKKLLCQKDKSVEILWLDNVINNSIIHKKGDLEKINFEQTISQVIWYPRTDEHLVIAADNSIIVTELDNRLPRNTFTFISTEKPEIKYNTDQKMLYFYTQKKLYQTEL